jgi:hypothetical protein
MARKRWQPRSGDPIGPKEPIGRRLFEEPTLVGAKDQKPKVFLNYRAFEENRPPYQVSFDRLGEKSRDDKVVDFLVEKAVNQGHSRKPPRDFHGWVHLPAALLTQPRRGTLKFVVEASPIAPDDASDPPHNPYHAHISPPTGASGPTEPMTVALYLQAFFSDYGEVLPYLMPPSNQSIPAARPSLLKRAINLVRSLWPWH